MSNASTPARSACASRALARAAGAVAAAVLSTFVAAPTAYGQRVFGLDTSSAANTNAPSQTAWNNSFNDADGDGVAYKFAFVRSSRGGTSDATRLDDGHFYSNISRATTAGMLAGSYHYTRPDVNTHTAVDDANHYLERAGMYMKPGYLLPVFDLEAGNTNHSTASLTTWGLDFIDTIHAATGVNPIVYTNSSYNNDEVNANLAWLNVDGSTSTPHTNPRTFQWVARPSGSLTTGQPGAATNYPNPYGVWDPNFNSRTNSRDPAVNPWAFWQNGAGTPNGFLIDFNAANGNIEFVKDFLVPALWTNAGSGEWGTIANWNSDNPGHIAGNTATGPAPRLPNNSALDWVKLQNPGGGTVTISSGARTVRKFYTQQPLNITGGSLNVSYQPGSGGKWDLPSEFAAPVAMAAGASYTAHTTQVSGGGGAFNLNGGTVTARSIDLASHASNAGKLVMVGGTVTFNAYGGTGTSVIRSTGALAQPGVVELGTPLTTAPTFSVGNGSAGVDLDVRATVTGAGRLAKTGVGTMQLSAANTYAGGTTVGAGILQVTADNRLGAVPGSAQANNIVLSGGTLRTGTQVNSVSLTNAGSGYTSFPTLTIGGAGADAHPASANVLARISSIAVTNGGSGYVNQTSTPPANGAGTFVDIVGGGGTGATARAIVSGGVVTGIVITNAGTGYTSMPTIHISSTAIAGEAGEGAAASVNGIALQGIALNDGGFDYANPTISLTGGGGSGATASATSTPNWTLSANRGIQLGTNGGTLYQTAGTTLNYGGIISSQVGISPGTLTKSGPGTLVLGGANTYAGATTVTAGTLVAAHADAIGDGGLTLASGATARMQSGVGGALSVSALTVNGTGRVDLNDGALVTRNGGAGAAGQAATQQITAYLKTGLENGGNFNWLGNGIRSTEANADNTAAGSVLYGLGVIQNNLAAAGSPDATTTDATAGNEIYTSFEGRTVALNDTLVRYTYMGDADLDGEVTSTDYSLIDSGFASNLAGWLNGDFDYSGGIDSTDYALIDNTFASQLGPLSEPFLARYNQSVATFGQSYVDALAAVQSGVVPEPGTLGVLALAGVGLLGRRGRRRLGTTPACVRSAP